MECTGYNSKTTIANALKELRDDLMVLTWDKGWGNKQCHKANGYHFNYDAMGAAAKEQSEQKKEPESPPETGTTAGTPAAASSTPQPSAESTQASGESTPESGKSTPKDGKSSTGAGRSADWTLTSHRPNVPSLTKDPSSSNFLSSSNFPSSYNVPSDEDLEEEIEKSLRKDLEQIIVPPQPPAEGLEGGEVAPSPHSAQPPSPTPKTGALQNATPLLSSPLSLKDQFPVCGEDKLYTYLSNRELREMLSDEHARLFEKCPLSTSYMREVLIGMLRQQRLAREKASATVATSCFGGRTETAQ